MSKRTALYACHLASQGKMVDFAGWELPIHYGSQLAEHLCVREGAGLFDVSHMSVLDLEGEEAATYLRYLLANNIDRLKEGQALYSCLLNEAGGILDDLIVYKIKPTFFRLVVNAATAAKDWAWMSKQLASFKAILKQRLDLAMLALQGPKALEKLSTLFPQEASQLKSLKPFQALAFQQYFIARTGYTGENGYELMLPALEAPALWQRLLDSGFRPCGLGARDTLRLEAGLNLYGSDMDEAATPLESNLAWTVAFDPKDRHFIGRQALEQQLQKGLERQLVGLLLEEQGIPRHQQKVFVEGGGSGEITSGSFSPILKKGIALARLPVGHFEQCTVEIRNKRVLAKIIKLPFVKKAQCT